MGRRPVLPTRLLRGPFTVEEAERAGLTRWRLEGASWTRLGPSTYISTRLCDDPIQRLRAVLRRLPPVAAFSGLTAAWLHGMDVPPCEPIEVTVSETAGVSARAGVRLRRSTFERGDIVIVRGLPATSIVRTLGEVCGRLSLMEAIVIADGALHDRRIKPGQLESWAEANSGRRGIKNLRRVLQNVEPATESPMESRLRMILVLGAHGRRRRSPFMTAGTASSAASTSTTKTNVWASNTTAASIATTSLKTIAGRTSCLARAFVSFDSPQPMSTGARRRSSPRCGQCSRRRRPRARPPALALLRLDPGARTPALAASVVPLPRPRLCRTAARRSRPRPRTAPPGSPLPWPRSGCRGCRERCPAPRRPRRATG